MPRRKNTVPEQPVRFYKYVALSFLCVTALLFAVIVFMSSKRAEIIIVAKKSPITIEKTVTVASEQGPGGVLGAVTSTVITISEEFEPTGTRQEQGQAAGVVTLHNDLGFNQPLVPTTRLLTADGVLFRLRDRVVVPANGTIEAAVYADEEGAAGNIGPVERFSIPGFSDPVKQENIYASSDSAMTGGIRNIGIVSELDITKATEALEASLLELGEAALTNLYPEFSGVFELGEAAISADVEEDAEVESFTISAEVPVVGVFYDAEALQMLAEKELMKRAIDENELVKAGNEMPAVALDSYDLDVGTAAIEVVYSGTATLNPESKQLQKLMFFGKTKAEVRRYVLSLDHIESVDVVFKPLWIRTIPFVPEHVTVKVRVQE